MVKRIIFWKRILAQSTPNNHTKLQRSFPAQFLTTWMGSTWEMAQIRFGFQKIKVTTGSMVMRWYTLWESKMDNSSIVTGICSVRGLFRKIRLVNASQPESVNYNTKREFSKWCWNCLSALSAIYPTCIHKCKEVPIHQLLTIQIWLLPSLKVIYHFVLDLKTKNQVSTLKVLVMIILMGNWIMQFQLIQK